MVTLAQVHVKYAHMHTTMYNICDSGLLASITFNNSYVDYVFLSINLSRADLYMEYF